MPSAETVPFESWRAWWGSTNFAVSLMSGAVAGFVCELALYPVDTVKTRMQAPGGLRPSGGFGGLYRGVAVTLAGSVPCSALFFVTYEGSIPPLNALFRAALEQCGVDRPEEYANLRHCVVNATGAAIGEGVAASVRTPIEALKQQCQVGRTFTARPRIRALWRGWGATLLRDLPFSMIQYPLYHAFKRHVAEGEGEAATIEPWKAALCGSCTSATAAALTTPFDVAQTRVMLAETPADRAKSPLRHLADVYATRGLQGCFAGVLPRAAWMGLGGLIFLGSYEQARASLDGATRRLPLFPTR